MRQTDGDDGAVDAGGAADTALRDALAEARRLRDAGHAKAAARAYGTALDAATRARAPRRQADAYLGLARCERDRGELERSLAHYAAAERLLAGAPAAARSAAVRGRAVVHLMAGDTRYGCHLLERAVDELNAEGGDPGPDADALVLLHATLISPYVDMGEHERAARAAELADGLLPRTRDPESAAYLWRQTGRTLVDEGRFAEAEEALARAQSGYERIGMRMELAQCHWARGYVYAQQGRLEEAERELATARDLLRRYGSQLITTQVEVELADVWRRRGRTGRASELLTRMLRDLGGDRGAVHAAAAHHLLGTILAEAGDPAEAERHYRAALVLRHRSGLAGDLAETCRRLGDLLHREGRTPEAVEVYRFGLGGLSRPGATTLGPAPRTAAGPVPGPAAEPEARGGQPPGEARPGG